MTGLTCDTSVLVPALLSWHPDHGDSREAMRDVDSLPAHVLLETYSVLTRLPPQQRFAAGDAAASIASLKFEVAALPAEQHQRLVKDLADLGISGGAVYDGLIGATARHHSRRLLTRDRRARATYDAIGTSYTMI